MACRFDLGAYLGMDAALRALKFSDYRLVRWVATLQVSEIDSDHLALIDIPSNAAEKVEDLDLPTIF